MAKKITVIKPIRDGIRVLRKKKLRVCAYVRVSTGSDAQANSFITMITYYTELIESNPEWEFVGIYADEAITGTKVDKREEFQTMIQECEEGNIDLIITKTVTRFGRNTVETLRSIRRLKVLGIGVYFESQKINTLTEDEFLQENTVKLVEFDNELVRRIVSRINVLSVDRIQIQLKSGIILEEELR